MDFLFAASAAETDSAAKGGDAPVPSMQGGVAGDVTPAARIAPGYRKSPGPTVPPSADQLTYVASTAALAIPNIQTPVAPVASLIPKPSSDSEMSNAAEIGSAGIVADSDIVPNSIPDAAPEFAWSELPPTAELKAAKVAPDANEALTPVPPAVTHDEPEANMAAPKMQPQPPLPTNEPPSPQTPPVAAPRPASPRAPAEVPGSTAPAAPRSGVPNAVGGMPKSFAPAETSPGPIAPDASPEPASAPASTTPVPAATAAVPDAPVQAPSASVPDTTPPVALRRNTPGVLTGRKVAVNSKPNSPGPAVVLSPAAVPAAPSAPQPASAVPAPQPSAVPVAPATQRSSVDVRSAATDPAAPPARASSSSEPTAATSEQVPPAANSPAPAVEVAFTLRLSPLPAVDPAPAPAPGTAHPKSTVSVAPEAAKAGVKAVPEVTPTSPAEEIGDASASSTVHATAAAPAARSTRPVEADAAAIPTKAAEQIQTLQTPTPERAPERQAQPDTTRPVPEPRTATAADPLSQDASLKPPAPLRALEFQLQSDQGRVAVRLASRAGEVSVDVRTPDSHLASTLRSELPELAAKIEQTGYRTEVWHPAAAATADRARAVESTASAQDFQNPHQGGQGGRQEQEQDPRRQAAPESPSPRKNERKEFQWLFNSIR